MMGPINNISGLISAMLIPMVLDRGDDRMYANIHEKYIIKHKETAKKEAIAIFGEKDREDMLIFDEVSPDTIDEIEFEDDKINITFSNDMGSFSIEIPLDGSDWERLLSVIIRRMNKIKTLIENLNFTLFS